MFHLICLNKEIIYGFTSQLLFSLQEHNLKRFQTPLLWTVPFSTTVALERRQKTTSAVSTLSDKTLGKFLQQAKFVLLLLGKCILLADVQLVENHVIKSLQPAFINVFTPHPHVIRTMSSRLSYPPIRTLHRCVHFRSCQVNYEVWISQTQAEAES